MKKFVQTLNNDGLGRIHALAQGLHSEIIAIAIHHQPGQAIGFAIDQTIGIGPADDPFAEGRGRADSCRKKSASIVSGPLLSIRNVICEVEL